MPDTVPDSEKSVMVVILVRVGAKMLLGDSGASAMRFSDVVRAVKLVPPEDVLVCCTIGAFALVDDCVCLDAELWVDVGI